MSNRTRFSFWTVDFNKTLGIHEILHLLITSKYSVRYIMQRKRKRKTTKNLLSKPQRYTTRPIIVMHITLYLHVSFKDSYPSFVSTIKLSIKRATTPKVNEIKFCLKLKLCCRFLVSSGHET